jgi:hypothetical protein
MGLLEMLGIGDGDDPAARFGTEQVTTITGMFNDASGLDANELNQIRNDPALSAAAEAMVEQGNKQGFGSVGYGAKIDSTDGGPDTAVDSVVRQATTGMADMAEANPNVFKPPSGP